MLQISGTGNDMEDDSVVGLSSEEQRIYNVIKRETETSGGIKQTLLRRHPELKDLDPKMITQVVRKLIKLNIVERITVRNGSRRAYVLVAKSLSQADKGTRKSTDTKLRNEDAQYLESLLLSIPCIRCRYLDICGIKDMYSPLRCPSIAYFILEKAGLISGAKALNNL